MRETYRANLHQLVSTLRSMPKPSYQDVEYAVLDAQSGWKEAEDYPRFVMDVAVALILPELTYALADIVVNGELERKVASNIVLRSSAAAAFGSNKGVCVVPDSPAYWDTIHKDIQYVCAGHNGGRGRRPAVLAPSLDTRIRLRDLMVSALGKANSIWQTPEYQFHNVYVGLSNKLSRIPNSPSNHNNPAGLIMLGANSAIDMLHHTVMHNPINPTGVLSDKWHYLLHLAKLSIYEFREISVELRRDINTASSLFGDMDLISTKEFHQRVQALLSRLGVERRDAITCPAMATFPMDVEDGLVLPEGFVTANTIGFTMSMWVHMQRKLEAKTDYET